MSRSQYGVAMVEFVIVVPLLLIILFGITELGRALYQQNTLYTALSTGSRYMARSADIVVADTNSCTKVSTLWDPAEAAAMNLIINDSNGNPLIPSLLKATAEIEIDAIPFPLPKTQLDGADVEDEWVCVITISATTGFDGMFTDPIIPFTGIKPFQIMAETEERYIGR